MRLSLYHRRDGIAKDTHKIGSPNPVLPHVTRARRVASPMLLYYCPFLLFLFD